MPLLKKSIHSLGIVEGEKKIVMPKTRINPIQPPQEDGRRTTPESRLWITFLSS